MPSSELPGVLHRQNQRTDLLVFEGVSKTALEGT
jgi:hypothetical protein